MIIHTETSLPQFDFWGGARDRVKYLTEEELDSIEMQLDDIYPEGLSETQVNDLFWFDDDFIAELIGYESFEEVMNRE